MIWIDHPLMFWIMVAVQLGGLLSLAATRVGERSSVCVPCRCLFFVCLLLVGFATILSVTCGLGQWASGGTTLSVMVVGATLDLRREARHSAW